MGEHQKNLMGEILNFLTRYKEDENDFLKPRLHDASNTSNVGHRKHSTHRVAEVRMTNDKWPASNVGVGR